MTDAQTYDQTAAEVVLRRFDKSITWATDQLAKLYEPHVTAEDIREDAGVLICVYAGIIPGSMHYGRLEDVEREAKGDESRVLAIVRERLRMHLAAEYGQFVARQPPTWYIEDLRDEVFHNDPGEIGFASNLIDAIVRDTKLRERYPLLVRKYLDGVTERDIAAERGVIEHAVWNDVLAEKAKAREDPDIFDLVAATAETNETRNLVYSTWLHANDKPPDPASVRQWSAAGRCVECGAARGMHAVRETCSLNCWISSSARRIKNEHRSWDKGWNSYRSHALAGKVTELHYDPDEDPINESPESYYYDGIHPRKDKDAMSWVSDNSWDNAVKANEEAEAQDALAEFGTIEEWDEHFAKLIAERKRKAATQDNHELAT